MTILANYPGTCAACHQKFPSGTEITKLSDGRYGHVVCPAHASAPTAKPTTEKIRRNAKAEHCKRCGLYLKAGEGRLLSELDDEDDERVRWFVLCLEKPDCDARRAEVMAQLDARAEALRERKERLRALEKRFIDAGDTPKNSDPEGKYKLDRIYLSHQDSVIYGGGKWAVIEPEVVLQPRYIWYVINNGHDGDDWSYNNYRTGGAGAVGRCLPWTAELEADVRALEHIE